jgi:hypothetical protein
MGFCILGGTFYYMCGLFPGLFFFQLAKAWPQLMEEWHELECSMKNFGMTTKMKLKFNLITASFLSLATSTFSNKVPFSLNNSDFISVEYISIVGFKISFSMINAKTVEDVIQQYFVYISFPQIFERTSFSLWKGIVLEVSIVYLTTKTLESFIFQVANFQCSFSCSYIAVFLVLITTGLAMRMKQIVVKTEHLIKHKVSDFLDLNKHNGKVFIGKVHNGLENYS